MPHAVVAETETKLKSLLVSNISAIFALGQQRCFFSLRYDTVNYEEDDEHELLRLFRLWTDPEYLIGFYNEHTQDLLDNDFYARISKERFIEDTYAQVQQFRRRIAKAVVVGSIEELDEFFSPLDPREEERFEYKLLKKAKANPVSWLRLYGVRTNNDMFFIVGGAIKLVRTMDERKHLIEQLDQMKSARKELSQLVRGGMLFTLVI